ncbi:metal-dependent hydrolase [Acinetobacter haemolyticus]|nr:hypothetical protein [Acinetobacter haemolyticus]SUU09981.1 metal-dependent hydrolase [Acinetobacter haemolyticus]
MALANVNQEKSYLNRPKALGITVRRLQFNQRWIRKFEQHL